MQPVCLKHNRLDQEVGHGPDAVGGADHAHQRGPAVAEAVGGQADREDVDGFIAKVAGCGVRGDGLGSLAGRLDRNWRAPASVQITGVRTN